MSGYRNHPPEEGRRYQGSRNSPKCREQNLREARIAIVAGPRVDNMAKVPLTFHTYVGILANAATRDGNESLMSALPPP
jgi:hypothetical protein